MWPSHITDLGGIRNQFRHIIDNAPSTHHTQYFEMMGDHALYHDGWIASTKVIRQPWEVIGPVNQDPFNNVTWELTT